MNRASRRNGSANVWMQGNTANKNSHLDDDDDHHHRQHNSNDAGNNESSFRNSNSIRIVISRLLDIVAVVTPKSIQQYLGINRRTSQRQQARSAVQSSNRDRYLTRNYKLVTVILIGFLIFIVFVKYAGLLDLKNIDNDNGTNGNIRVEDDEISESDLFFDENNAEGTAGDDQSVESQRAETETIKTLFNIAQKIERQSEGLGLFDSSAFAFSEYRLKRISSRSKRMAALKKKLKDEGKRFTRIEVEKDSFEELLSFVKQQQLSIVSSAARSPIAAIMSSSASTTANSDNNENEKRSAEVSASDILSIDPVFSPTVFEHNNALAASREGNFAISDFDDFTTEELMAAAVLFRAEAFATLASSMEHARLRALRRRGLHADNRNLLKGKAAEANNEFLRHKERQGKDENDNEAEGEDKNDDGDVEVDFDDVRNSKKKSGKKKEGDEDSSSDAKSKNNKETEEVIEREKQRRRKRGSSDVVPLRACFITLANHESRPTVDKFGNAQNFNRGSGHDTFLTGGGLTNLHRLLVNVRQTLPLMASRYPFIVFHEDTSVISSEAIGKGLLEKEKSFNEKSFQFFDNPAAVSSELYTYGGSVDFEPLPDEMARKRLRRRRRLAAGIINNRVPNNDVTAGDGAMSIRRAMLEAADNDRPVIEGDYEEGAANNHNNNNIPIAAEDNKGQYGGQEEKEENAKPLKNTVKTRAALPVLEAMNNNNNTNQLKNGENGGGAAAVRHNSDNINKIPDAEENKRLGRVEGDRRNDVERLADEMMPVVKENHKEVDDWNLRKNQVLRAAKQRLERIRSGEEKIDEKYEEHNAIGDMLNLEKNMKEKKKKKKKSFLDGDDDDDDSGVDSENVPVGDSLEITHKMIDRVEREGARGELLAALSRFVFPRTISNPYCEDNQVSTAINAGSYAQLMATEAPEGRMGKNGLPPPVRLKRNPLSKVGFGARHPYEVLSVYTKRVVAEHELPTDGSLYILNAKRGAADSEGREEEDRHEEHVNDAKAALVGKQKLVHKAVLNLERDHGWGAVDSGEYAARLKALEDASNVRNVAAKPAWKIHEEQRLAQQRKVKEEIEEYQQRREMEKLLRLQKYKDKQRVAFNREDEKIRDELVVGDRGAESEHRIRPGLYFEPVPPSDFGAIPPWVDTTRDWPVPVGGSAGGGRHQQMINDGLVARNKAEAEMMAERARRKALVGGHGGARQQESSTNDGLGFRHMSRFFGIRIFSTKFFSAKDPNQLNSRQFDYFFRLDTDAFILATPLYTQLDAVLERKRYQWQKVDISRGKPVYEMKANLQRTGHFKLQERDLFLAMAERRLLMGFSSIDTAKDSLYTNGMLDVYDEFIAEEERALGENIDNVPEARSLFAGSVGGVHPLSDITSIAPRKIFAHWTSFAEIINLNTIRSVKLDIPRETEDAIHETENSGAKALFATNPWTTIRSYRGEENTKSQRNDVGTKDSEFEDGSVPRAAKDANTKSHASSLYFKSNIDELRLAYANIDEEIQRKSVQMDTDMAAEMAKVKPKKGATAEEIAVYNAQFKALLKLKASQLKQKADKRRKIQIELQEELENKRRSEIHLREQELILGLRVPSPEEARLVLTRNLLSSTLGHTQLPEFQPAKSFEKLEGPPRAKTNENAETTEMDDESNRLSSKYRKTNPLENLTQIVIDENTELESRMSVSDALKAYFHQKGNQNPRVTSLALKRFLDDKIRFVLESKHYQRARAVARARALRQVLLLDSHSPLLGVALDDYLELMKRFATTHNLRSSLGNRFLERVEKSGGIYYHRWSDSLVRTTHLSLIAEPNEVAHLDTFAVQHREAYHCHRAKTTLTERNAYGYLTAGLGSREGLVYDTNLFKKDSSEGPLSAAKNRALHGVLSNIVSSSSVSSILDAHESLASGTLSENDLREHRVPLAVLRTFLGSGRWFRTLYDFSFAKTEAGAERSGGGEPTVTLSKLLRLLEETLLPEAPEDWGFADYSHKENSLAHLDLPLVGLTLQSYRRPNIEQRKIQRELEKKDDLQRFVEENNPSGGAREDSPYEHDSVDDHNNRGVPFWNPKSEEDLFEAVTVARGIEMFASFSGEGLTKAYRNKKQGNREILIEEQHASDTKSSFSEALVDKDPNSRKPLIVRRIERIQDAILLRTPPHSLVGEHTRASTVSCVLRAKKRHLVLGGVSKASGASPFDPAENPVLDDGVIKSGRECGDGWPRV